MHTRHQRRSFGRLLQKFPEALRFMRASDGHRLGRRLAELCHMAKSGSETPAAGQVLPLKDIRLAMLADSGLNCPDFRSYRCGKLNRKEEEDLYQFFMRHKALSLRNFTEERLNEPSPRLPVRYNEGSWNKVLDFCRSHNARYHTLVNESLALADSVYCGNIILCEGSYICAYIHGTGTPRMVDEFLNESSDAVSRSASKFIITKRSYGDPSPEHAPSGMTGLAVRLREFLPSHRPVTIEWSRYPYEVGKLKEKDIFWEWRGSAEHDLHMLKEYLLSAGSGYDIAIELPVWTKSA